MELIGYGIVGFGAVALLVGLVATIKYKFGLVVAAQGVLLVLMGYVSLEMTETLKRQEEILATQEALLDPKLDCDDEATPGQLPEIGKITPKVLADVVGGDPIGWKPIENLPIEAWLYKGSEACFVVPVDAIVDYPAGRVTEGMGVETDSLTLYPEAA
jgi:hypothetical protein